MRVALALLLLLAGCYIGADDHADRLDADADGAVAAAHGGPDCDDDDPGVRPGADETCDGADEDCDGAIDDDPVDGVTFYVDADGDGFGAADTVTGCARPDGAATRGGDCDDAAPDALPGAPDDDCDGVDDDCDGTADQDGALTWWPDADEDGFGDDDAAPTLACAAPDGTVDVAGDCDDADDAVNPDASDACGDGIDADCDGSDEAAPFWPDADGDGHGAAGAFLLACVAPAGHAPDDEDCDDGDDDVRPDAVETCNAVDDDCDGQIDEELGC